MWKRSICAPYDWIYTLRWYNRSEYIYTAKCLHKPWPPLSPHLSHLPSKTNTGLLNSLKASRHGSFTLVPSIVDVRRWSDCDTVQTSYHAMGLAGFIHSFHIVIIQGEGLEPRNEAVKGHIHWHYHYKLEINENLVKAAMVYVKVMDWNQHISNASLHKCWITSMDRAHLRMDLMRYEFHI